MTRVELRSKATPPLVLEVRPAALVAELAGPAGATGPAAERIVEAAISSPPAGPPLASHAVPGDRVVIAVAGGLPQARQVISAVTAHFADAGITGDSLSILHAGPPAAGLDTATEFHAAAVAETAYLAADEAGHPLHVARRLVDADVVVAVGEWSFDARLGGRSLGGELWPAFGRQECDADLNLDLARRGRRALHRWRANLEAVIWQLGVTACLRVVAGRDGSLAAAAFGMAEGAALRARAAAAAWAPAVTKSADLAVCSVSRESAGFGTVARVVAAAARITRPGGTICVIVTTEPPGPVVMRSREGAPLDSLVREARRSGDPTLVADAVEARFLARGLADRRLVLLSNLDETLVEDLEFGYAASPDAVQRLVRRAESVVIIHEADLMFPQLP
jgi:hypothetical protein